VTRIAAHRGGAALWPENSLLAFRNAIALGADLLELDVHLARDGTMAVIHDATVERTTDGAGAIGSMTAADLRRLRLRGPDGATTTETVPTLDQVIAAAAPTDVGLLIEVKGPAPGVRYDGLEERILAALAGARLGARGTVMAFNPDVIGRLRVLAPPLRTTLLVSRGAVAQAGIRAEASIEWAVAAGVTDVGLEHTLVDQAVIAAARAARLTLGVWTVNEEAAMRRMLTLGVDVLTTDRPDVARRLLPGRP
jgi:glycerophosphoryl diester phosphodiesterase